MTTARRRNVDRFDPGVLVLPDREYDAELARAMKDALVTIPYLDAMGFDSYHPPVWPSDMDPPSGFKTFRYDAVSRTLLYLFRRRRDKTQPVSAFDLRRSMRRYVAASKTLQSTLHPYATYGEITLAALIIGLRVDINTVVGSGHRYSPIIHIGGHVKGYEYRGKNTV
jgi:hypothetical protein